MSEENATKTTDNSAANGGCSPVPCSLPSQFRGPFFGCGMGKVFIRTKQGDTGVLDIRGWGYLTGQGALAMGEDEACKIQDQFEEWVIAALNHFAENETSPSVDANEKAKL